ncbi:hypothetical protein QVD17_39478 [Tagetes erecta]|uniref:Uncharacterized protein n=1 Tax=Tagetes erecta TaxID=13708 RepID=A0AAD8NH63_TARER|nr:hypothetical protein QVD17_39478 [Tagetes erecta]
MEKVSLDSSGMKGIALMVKNMDGAPIRKGILKGGIGLKPRSLSDDLSPNIVEDPIVVGSSLKVEAKVDGNESEVTLNSKPIKGSYAGMLKEAANKKALNPNGESGDEVVMEIDGTKSVTTKSSNNMVEPLSDEDDVQEETSMDEERFLKQKSKVNWLAAGDANTSFFHMSLKSRNHKSRVEIVRDINDISHEGREVPKVFVKHYEDFLGGDKRSAKVIMDSLQSFASMSGLIPSVQKSTVFFCNVKENVRLDILHILPFEEGKLPISSAGLALDAKVADVYLNGNVMLSVAWFDLFHVLYEMVQPNSTVEDQLVWKDGDKSLPFSSRVVWNSIRTRDHSMENNEGNSDDIVDQNYPSDAERFRGRGRSTDLNEGRTGKRRRPMRRSESAVDLSEEDEHEEDDELLLIREKIVE